MREPGQDMDLAEMTVVERLARTLAGWKLSDNAEGMSGSAGPDVDADWPDQLDLATALLKAIREPDATLVGSGQAQTWTAMVEAAIAARAGIDLPTAGPF